MALYSGSPVARSHTRVVSRWLVTPMAWISAASSRDLASASVSTATCEAQISLPSCSTQPGLGKYWLNGRWATDTISPRWSKMMARDDVVPWSRAMM